MSTIVLGKEVKSAILVILLSHEPREASEVAIMSIIVRAGADLQMTYPKRKFQVRDCQTQW
jgi:hypothetical protein